MTTWPVMTVAMTATLAAPVPGIRDIRRGTYQPVVITWLIWAVLTGEGGWSSLVTGQLPSAAYTFGCAAGCAVVAVLGLRVPAGQREAPVRVAGLRLDWVCGAGGAAGVVMLVAARDPVTAMVVTVATDFVAYVPTLVRASPDEPWLSYVLYAVGGAGVLATLAPADWRMLTGWLYAVYILAADAVMVALIFGRRRAENRACRAWVRAGVLQGWANGPR